MTYPPPPELSGASPPAGTAGEYLSHIRGESTTPHEKGEAFERLVSALLLNLPEYGIKQIWNWANWPDRERLLGLDGVDTGIDLVAQRHDGTRIAIQCKCYDSAYRVAKRDVDGFLAASSRKEFSSRILVATCPWTDNAERTVQEQEKDIRRIDFDSDLADIKLTWDGIKPKVALEIRELWSLQADALRDAQAHYKNSSRGILQMACGTGKTFVSLKIAESLTPANGFVLFVAPSLALVSQAHREYLRCRSPDTEMNTVIVCSDRTAGRAGRNDILPMELAASPSTDPDTIAKAVSIARNRSGRTVIFSTYQSLSKVSEAQRKHKLPDFHLAIADEAHQTTGAVVGDQYRNFQLIHDDTKVKAKNRLYMTATPRVYNAGSYRAATDHDYELIDMSDDLVYGQKFHNLNFRKAVNEGMLADFKVIVLAMDPHDIRINNTGLVGKDGRTPTDIARVIGSCMAINGCAIDESGKSPGPLKRVVAFANTVARSKRFSEDFSKKEILENVEKESGIKIEAEHVDGTHTALQRNHALRRLRDPGEGTRVLCNAKLLTEGIDIAALDAVIFLDPRQSQVDVVQAVGRVMRSSPDTYKKYGYVVIPVIVPMGEDPERTLDLNHEGFRALWQVLAAMRSHDELFAKELEGDGLDPDQRRIYIYHPWVERGKPRPPGGDGSVTELSPMLPLQIQKFTDQVYARVLKQVGKRAYPATTAGQIDYAVRRAAALLKQHSLGGVLAYALEITPDPGTGDDRATKIACLLICNACLLHHRLHEVLPNIPRLNDIVSSADVRMGMLAAWKSILRHDYRPVFEVAIQALETLPSKESERALKNLAFCARNNADSIADMGFDHAGPLYHRLLPSATSDGAFYTNNVSAALLADLALDKNFCDWNDLNAIKKIRIIDPACGTGTLLMAALRQIQKNHAKGIGINLKKRKQLHKILVEHVLCGLDINPHGVQMAALNLTLGAVTVDYQKMNLHTMPHGPQSDGECKAGSLEILETFRDDKGLLAPVNPQRGIRDLEAEQVDSSQVIDNYKLRDVHMVIINPPFTNNANRSQRFTPKTRRQMQQRESYLAQILREWDDEAGRVVNSNSVQTYFIPIADMLLSDKGTLAMIIPATACLGESAKDARQFVASRFLVELVLTSHDPKRINFSENTDIHETILIARRNTVGKSKPTKFVSIHRMPQSADEASQLASAIRVGKSETIAEWGTMTEWPSDEVQAGNWSPTQWYDHSLAGICKQIRCDPNTCRVLSKFSIGPAGRRLHAAFDKVKVSSGSGHIKAFYSTSSKLRQTMNACPEQAIVAKPGEEMLAERYKRQRSRLLVNQRLDTMAGRITSLYSPTTSFGTGWVPVTVENKDTAKALCAWFNSIPGVLGFLNNRSKKLTYPAFSLAHLSSLPIPDPDKVDLAPLTDAWKEVSDEPLQPFRAASIDPARQILDRAAAKILGVAFRQVQEWAEKLSREPTVCGAAPGGDLD